MGKVCFQCNLFFFFFVKKPRSQRKLMGKNCLLTGSADLMVVRDFIGPAKLVLMKYFDAIFH